jgi:alpha-mannosidase
LHLTIEVNFDERFTLLQLPVHLAATPSRWIDGLPGGQVERRPGPTEWPVQGWSRVDVEETRLAMVTNDAYSLSLDGDCWQWTLLRSPKMAWMGSDPPVYAGHDWHTDQGPHVFHFVLCAEAGLDETALHTLARQQAQPPIVFSRYAGMQRPPWTGAPPRHMWGPAEHRAQADGRMPVREDHAEKEADL